MDINKFELDLLKFLGLEDRKRIKKITIVCEPRVRPLITIEEYLEVPDADDEVTLIEKKYTITELTN